MKNKFKILLTSMIFCLCLISVPLILSGCGKGNGGDGNIQINTINYDFTYYGLESYFDNYKLFDCLTQNEKLTNLPTLKTGVSGSLEGWYIKGTNTKVEENQEIESDVTLVAKWNIPPAGLYQNNYLTMNWDDMVNTYTNYYDTGLNFDDKPLIGHVVIDQSITSLDQETIRFDNNHSNVITGITIPKTVTFIEKDFIYLYDQSLSKIEVEPGNNIYHSAGNCLIETQSKTLILGTNNSVIPNDNSVISIGEGAFEYCTGLKNITIPNSVTSIGNYAFSGCYNLTSITIPNSVISIGDYAFSSCNSLTSITIPNSVTSIGDKVFRWCDNLTSIVVQQGNNVYHSAGNCLIETQSKTLIRGTNNSVIPNDNSVISIGDYAFSGCDSLTSITIPNSVTSIGNDAFSDCYKLTSITIPNSVTSIGDYAFSSCNSLTSITIPNSVTSIGDYAFSLCLSLTSITIPNSVTSIGDYAFLGCILHLETIYFQGNETEWNALIEDTDNWELTNGRIEIIFEN